MKRISRCAPVTAAALAMGLGPLIFWSMLWTPLDASEAPPRSLLTTAAPSHPALPTAAVGVLQAFLDESLPAGGIDRTKSLWQAPGRGAAAGSEMFPGKIDPRYLRYLIEILYRLGPGTGRAARVKVADAHVGYLASAVNQSHPTWVLGNALEAIGLHHAHHGGRSPYAARAKEIVVWLRARKVEVRLPDGTTFGHFPCGYGILSAKDAGWTNDLSMAGAGLVWAYALLGWNSDATSVGPPTDGKPILSAPLTHSDWVLKDNVPGLDDGLAGVRHMLDMCKAAGWSRIHWRCLDAGRSLYSGKLMDPMIIKEDFTL